MEDFTNYLIEGTFERGNTIRGYVVEQDNKKIQLLEELDGGSEIKLHSINLTLVRVLKIRPEIKKTSSLWVQYSIQSMLDKEDRDDDDEGAVLGMLNDQLKKKGFGGLNDQFVKLLMTNHKDLQSDEEDSESEIEEESDIESSDESSESESEIEDECDSDEDEEDIQVKIKIIHKNQPSLLCVDHQHSPSKNRKEEHKNQIPSPQLQLIAISSDLEELKTQIKRNVVEFYEKNNKKKRKHQTQELTLSALERVDFGLFYEDEDEDLIEISNQDGLKIALEDGYELNENEHKKMKWFVEWIGNEEEEEEEEEIESKIEDNCKNNPIVSPPLETPPTLPFGRTSSTSSTVVCEEQEMIWTKGEELGKGSFGVVFIYLLIYLIFTYSYDNFRFILLWI